MISDLAIVDRVRMSRRSELSIVGSSLFGAGVVIPGFRERRRALLHDRPGSTPSPALGAPKGASGREGDAGTPADGRDEDAAVPVFRVLLLEDDAIDVRLIQACAAAIGSLRLTYEVVSSVAAARERVASQAFDICITDFWLGFESSLGFVAGLSRPGLGMPVIVLTSLSTPEIRRLCLRAGAACVIGKESLSPGVLESAVAEAMRETRNAAVAPDDRGASPERGLDFLDRFARIMRPAGEAAAAPPDRTGAARDPGALRAPIRAFAALSETARLAVLEQIVAAQDDDARAAGAAPDGVAADLVETAAKGCSLVEAQGRPVAFSGPARAMRLGCDEPALIFLAYELISRVSEVTADRSTIGVDLRQEDGTCVLRAAGPPYGSLPALPVTFGALFTSILRRCHGVVELVHDPGRSITLVARFPDDRSVPAKPRSH